MNYEVLGSSLRFSLENYGCDDYEEDILKYISEYTDTDYEDLMNNIKVNIYPSDNKRLIEFTGDESSLYELMVELSYKGHEPITRYPSLMYSYDILGKKIDVLPDMGDNNPL